LGHLNLCFNDDKNNNKQQANKQTQIATKNNWKALMKVRTFEKDDVVVT